MLLNQSNSGAADRSYSSNSTTSPALHLIVDYNGMLKSLREALAQYALGDDGDGGEEIVAPVEERVQALMEAIEATEAHLRGLGFDPVTLVGSTGFARIKGLKDAVEAVYSSDKAKRRFEILARQVFVRFKALLMEPSAFDFAERHDNIEAIYKKLTARRDTAGRDRSPEGAAPDRQRGDPHAGAGR